MKNLKNKLFIIFSLLCALALTSCMDLYDGSEVPTSFKVTFDGNGGSYVEGDIAATTYSQIYAFAEQKNLIANKFSKANCKFLGWAESATATTATFADEANFSTKTDRTLYAIWSEVTYTVTFVGNGGTTDQGEPSYTQEYKVGEEKKLIKNKFNTPDPDKEFFGWAKSATGERVYDDEQEIKVESNMTLYAMWHYSSTLCTITFHGEGGTTTDGKDSYSFNNREIGKAEQLPANLFKNFPEGKRFKGWKTNPETRIYSDKDMFTPDKKNIDLYAVWIETTLYVSSTGDDDNNDGLTKDSPFETMERAIKEIQDIKIATLTWKIYVNGTVTDTSTVTIDTLIAKSLEIDDVGVLENPVSVTNATLKVSSGRVIYVKDSVVTVKQVSISNGNADNGAGIYITGSKADVTLDGGKIVSNTATAAGGGVYINGGKFTLQSGSIGASGNANAAANGGGIYNAGGSVIMKGGDISYNTAGATSNGNGGGVYIASGKFEMSSGSITNNIAGYSEDTNKASMGGGIYNVGTLKILGGTIGKTITGEVTKDNCANYSNKYGGGIYNNSGTIEFSGTYSITGNFAHSTGGGIYSTNTTAGNLPWNSSYVTGNKANDNPESYPQ